ncbi:unnamed protein product [Adineta steineri]|uniref:Uncharacterized protein n=1 Tax=Adineta steineri TaxID=433720 RepID=A0A819MTR5_9BILA|nr:unnamed protein product [Adineta steineri]
MGKMIQLTHRLVGLLQVLEWTWKIIDEHLKIKGSFTGSISEEFLSDIRNIFNRLYETNINDKRTFMATVTSVNHAINIAEALLEQYKVLMRLPDDIVRSSCSNSNNSKSDIIERTVLNKKLEKSKSKSNEHIRGVLLFKSVVFTPTTLYRSGSVFKHYSANVNAVLKDLTNIGLIIPFKDGIISSTRKAMVYIKWLPKQNDELECQRFEQLLATFNDEQISADLVIASTTTVSLLPHKAVLRPFVLNYLKNERYSRLHIELNVNLVDQEDSNSINEMHNDSNSSNTSLEGLMYPAEIPSTGYFFGFEKEGMTSSVTEKNINSGNVRGKLVQHIVTTNVTSSMINLVSENTNTDGSMNGSAQNPSHTDKVINTTESGM